LTGVDPPKDHIVDGIALNRLLTGKADPEREEVFLMHYPHSPHRSDYFTVYRNGDWKVIYHYFPSKASEDSHYQLFNLANDPFEQHNLAAAEPARLRTMTQGLIAALESHGAQYPVDKTDKQTPVKPQLP
ncbi:MAG: N-acetylgalactosamine-6-sulfatase, partial [Planctomycetales bacterium]|nr:N-acetylgalactosamine-6-sulfatase [Planctomycetales bacterium]